MPCGLPNCLAIPLSLTTMITKNERYDLKKISSKPENSSKEETQEQTPKLLERLKDLQSKLYAQQKYSLLIVLQGMDTSGKDSAVKNVFSGINPTGCNVKAFKVPTEEEQKHDFLWRIHKEMPERGMIQIFNRSHYEDILAGTVLKLAPKEVLEQRYEMINNFEHLLVENNTIVMKFYLHVTQEEQLERLEERKTDPYKQWKYQEGDVQQIADHDKYLAVYEQILERCSKPVPWHIVPADKKWYKNFYILKAIVEGLEKYDINYPGVKKG
jgi:PPK2 family polyphosphate:nucleotide phosphotransferase